MDVQWTTLHDLLGEAARSFDMGTSALVMSAPNGSWIVYGLPKEAEAFVLASRSQLFKKALFISGLQGP